MDTDSKKRMGSGEGSRIKVKRIRETPTDFPHALDAFEFPHHSGFQLRPLAFLTMKYLAMFVGFFNTRRQLS